MPDPTANIEQSATNAVRDSFQRELNYHGYGFQFRVLKEARDLNKAYKSKWAFRVSEFPVQVQGSATKIDFILFRQPNDFWRADMICECKRANPATANWCFIRAPFVHRNYSRSADPLVLESLVQSNTTTELRFFAKSDRLVRNAYHVALPVRTGRKGDSQPVKQARSEIEDAASQVLKGTSGYVQTLSRNPPLTEVEGQDAIVRLLPVVFTTAKLFASNSDLSAADLETGDIDLQSGEFEQVSWLWYQYNVSPGIRHNISPVEREKKIEEYMIAEHVRSIAIVSSSGMEEFFTNESL